MKKPAVTSMRVAEGVYVSHGDRGFLIKEPRLETVIPRLLAMLDGARPAPEVRAALPDKVKEVFDLLWSGLAANAMLTCTPSLPLAPDTSPAVLQLLQNAMIQWEPCLHAWRAQSLTVWVDFDLVHLVVKPLIEQGVGQIMIIDQHGQAPQVLALAGIVEGVTVVSPAAAADHHGDRLLALVGAESIDAVRSLAPKYRRAIVGVVSPQGTAIAELSAASEQDLLEGSGLDLGDGIALPPRHCLSVAAAILAFEALRSVITEFSEDEEAIERRHNDVRVVRMDGTVVTHNRRVAAASGMTLAAVADHLVAGADPSLVEPADEWHHPLLGPFVEQAVSGPAFPLPHVSKLVRKKRDDGVLEETVVTAWGVDPAEAWNRCHAQAFEVLCGGMSRLAVAAGDAAAAEKSLALLRSVAACDGTPAPVDFDTAWSNDVKMMARLVRLYWGETPDVTVAGAEQARIARARLGDVMAVGTGFDADAAVRTALGELISTLQLGQPPTQQLRSPWRELRSRSGSALASGLAPAPEIQTFAVSSGPIVVAAIDSD